MIDLLEMNLTLAVINTIVFFILAANISGIKKTLRQRLLGADPWITYLSQKKAGNKEAAYSALLYMVYSKISASEWNPRKTYNNLKIGHEKDFAAIGYEFPEYPVSE